MSRRARGTSRAPRSRRAGAWVTVRMWVPLKKLRKGRSR